MRIKIIPGMSVYGPGMEHAGPYAPKYWYFIFRDTQNHFRWYRNGEKLGVAPHDYLVTTWVEKVRYPHPINEIIRRCV